MPSQELQELKDEEICEFVSNKCIIHRLFDEVENGELKRMFQNTEGEDDYSDHLQYCSDLTKLENFRKLINYLKERTEKHKVEIESKIKIDNLTKIYNQRFFEEQLKLIVEEQIRTLDNPEKTKKISLIYIDIDKFKKINDEYGHPVGDEVLIKTARIMQHNLRAGIDFPIRIGGDEFAIIFMEDIDIANGVANRIQKELNQFMRKGDLHIPIKLSIGIASLDLDKFSKTNSTTSQICQEWKEKADTSLYQAKKGGRNRICISGEKCCCIKSKIANLIYLLKTKVLNLI